MEQIPPRPAATIVVIRERGGVSEILMLRRASQTLSAPGAHVFPGGAVDPGDAAMAEGGYAFGLDAQAATRRLGLNENALAYYIAALRELFEEAGLLIVVKPSGRPATISAEQLSEWREELARRDVTWVGLFQRAELRWDLRAMHLVGHWVTPEGRSRRFDTRFFIAVAPPLQLALPDYGEVVEHVWTTPSEALRRYDAGEWTMLVPTVRTLVYLAGQPDMARAMRAASTLTVQRVQPREIERDGRMVVVVPGDPGYEE